MTRIREEEEEGEKNEVQCGLGQNLTVLEDK